MITVPVYEQVCLVQVGAMPEGVQCRGASKIAKDCCDFFGRVLVDTLLPISQLLFESGKA